LSAARAGFGDSQITLLAYRNFVTDRLRHAAVSWITTATQLICQLSLCL